MTKVAIVGATGYGGAELVRLLSRHPRVEISAVTSSRKAGEPLSAECPWLATDLVLSAFDPATIEADVVFLCQESGYAHRVAGELIARKMKVIDLSADFRLTDPVAHEAAYGFPRPALSNDAVYGLPELVAHDAYDGKSLIANPGCHPTAAALALAPLARAGMLRGTPVIDSMTGVSGAGRAKADPAFGYSELTAAAMSYKVVGHRHVAEIEQLVGVPVRFTPHLIPVARGMLAACHAPIDPAAAPHLEELYRSFYAFAPTVRVVCAPPSTKAVLGTVRCDLHVSYDPRTEMATVLSAIDNLGKGAAGAAVQNLNVLMTWDELDGLTLDGVWP